MTSLSVFRQRNLMLILLAQMVSYVGSILQTVALSLYVLGIARDQFATVLAVAVLPRLFAPLTGVLSDRFNRKHLLVLFDILAGVLTLAFAMLLRMTGGLQIWMIYLMVLVLSAVQTFSDPAASAILPDIVESQHLEQANSANSFLSNASSIAMPALAGLLYGTSGLFPVMLINAASFFLAAFSESLIRYQPHDQVTVSHQEPFFHSLREGFRIYMGSVELRVIIVITIAVNFALNPVLTVAMPYVLNVDLNVTPQVFGLSQSLVFLGPVLGSLVAGFLLKRVNYKRVIMAILIGNGVLVAAMAVLSYSSLLQPPWIQVLLFNVCAFLVVATMVIGGIACMSTLQRIVPTALMGRAMGVDSSLSVAAIPVGQWLLGWGMHRAGSPVMLAAFAAIALAVAIYSIFRYRPILRAEHSAKTKPEQTDRHMDT